MNRARIVASLAGVAALFGLWATYAPVLASMSHLGEMGNVLFGLFAAVFGAGTVYRVVFGFGLDGRHVLANLVVGGALLALGAFLEMTFLTRALDLFVGATLVGATALDVYRDAGADVDVGIDASGV